MAYDEKYRARAVAYKDSGHNFEQLKETFSVCNYSYYKWKRNKEDTGLYAPPRPKLTRKRKIEPEKLKQAVERKPDAYLREIAEQFGRGTTAVHKRLKQLNITYKKRHLPMLKSPGRRGRNT